MNFGAQGIGGEKPGQEPRRMFGDTICRALAYPLQYIDEVGTTIN